MGLLTDSDGEPMSVSLFPGNTNDLGTFATLMEHPKARESTQLRQGTQRLKRGRLDARVSLQMSERRRIQQAWEPLNMTVQSGGSSLSGLAAQRSPALQRSGLLSEGQPRDREVEVFRSE